MITATEMEKGSTNNNGNTAAQVKEVRGEFVHPDSFVQRVEKKAYELYEKRGYRHGHDLNDWFKALEIVEKEMIEGQ